MKLAKFATVLTALCIVGLLVQPASWAQAAPDRLAKIKAGMDSIKTLSKKFPAAQQRALSGAAQNLFHLAENWDRLAPGLARSSSAARSSNGAANGPASTISVSNPATDFAFSPLLGFTQSETSTAWCGNNVVVGFNDSGSFPESILFGPGGVSFNGVARSTNQGSTFQDLGFLNPSSNTSAFLEGDPVLGCTDANTFYYSSIFEDFSVPITAVSVSKSTDGGATFADPVVAAGKDLLTHFLDKDWMAVDPTSSSRVFVTYTDFDVTATLCGVDVNGFPIERVAIELVRSTDGGVTWSLPVVITQVCSTAPSFPFVQGSQAAVGPSGEVYVAWENYSDFFTRQIWIRKSTDNGLTFGAAAKVDNVTFVGDGFSLQGGFRAFIDLTGLTVDRSGTGTNGNVYVTWQDGRNLVVPFFDGYNYADILVSRSSNGGSTWSAATRVNDNSDPVPGGGGTDQYQPGIAVDKTGKIGICFYDRRMDPLNYMIDRFCAVSTNAGLSWSDKRQSSPSWAPQLGTDVLINPVYMGDYDGVASDFTQGTAGFIGAFQMMSTVSGNTIPVPNADVVSAKFR